MGTPRMLAIAGLFVAASTAAAAAPAPGANVAAAPEAFAWEGVQLAQARTARPIPDGRVRSAQRALAALKLDPGPIDGIAGPKTQAAVRTFQQQRRLPVTGELDFATMQALGVR